MTRETVYRLTSVLGFCFFSLYACLSHAQTPRDFAVDLSATVSTNVPRITLGWSIRRQGNIAAQSVHRRLKGDLAWVKQADLATNQTSYADGSALAGVEYEYWMERTYTGIYPSTAMGYLSAGVNVPMSEFRGTLLLVVDDTLAAPLAPDIEQLQSDLVGEGWAVQTLTVCRTGTALSVKAQIADACNADPLNVKMVYLLGHVPVPYSGNMAPDGNSDHVGAWPADGYYGELNGAWTDASVNNTAGQRTQNDNVPGDGKFDQNFFPDAVELMVGRVDMHSMTRAPASAASEAALLRRYLRKAHDFRMRQGAYASIPRRSLIRDGLGYVSGENSAIAGWAWAFTGAGSLVDEAPGDQWFSSAYAGNNSYLVAYGSGEGSFESASSVGHSADFGLKPSRALFTSLFGASFGDWDSDNNFLRAPLAGNATGDSLGLACFWGGRPNRFMHPMGMGETAGYCMRASQNGSFAGAGGYVPNNNAGVHSALMGDPALRLYPVAPARALTASSSNSLVSLSWAASAETNVLGYHVYRAPAVTGAFARLTSAPLATPAFTDSGITPGQSYCYLVRVLKREFVPGGSFDNLSAGTPLAITALAGPVAAPRNPDRLTVVPRASTNAVLSWADTSLNETGFRIERMTTAGEGFVPVGTVAANVTNFIDQGSFTNGMTYSYRVVATGGGASSPPSNVASFDATAGFFALSSTRLKVYKTAGSVTLSVSRIGGSNGVASVRFETVDSSALAGVHYLSATGTLTWPDGDASSKSISVPVVNTVAPQSARQFKVSLNAPSAGSGLTVNAAAAVLIEDPTASLSSPWSQAVISGITDSSPAVTVSGGICSVTVGGAGASSDSGYEAGQFIYQSKTGDGAITAFFPEGVPADTGARCALMIRANTTSSAIMAAAATSSGAAYGTKLAYRTEAGRNAETLPSASNALVLARWLRLVRTGSVFIAQTSPDGAVWTTVASVAVASMPASALWGVFHYSSDWSVTELGNYHLAIADSVSISEALPPSVPSNVVAAASSATQVSLTWPTVLYASYYSVERCSEYGSFTQLVDVVSGSSTNQTWTDNTVSADSGYAYRVCARNANGTSDYSPVAFVTTPASDIVTLLTAGQAGCADATVQRNLPNAPQGLVSNLTVASTDPESWGMLTNAAKAYLRFDLSGTVTPVRARLRLTFIQSDDFDAWNYYSLFFYALGQGANAWGEDTITWNNAPQNLTNALGFAQPNALLADAYDYETPEAGQETFFELDPSVLYASRATNNWVTLGLTQFGGALTRWASQEHPSFSSPALELSSLSLAPPRPSFLTAQVELGWAVTLRWQDGADSETGFELERRTAGGTFALLQNLASNTLFFIDQTAAPETSYEYRLRAVNASAPSSWTTNVSVTTPDVFSAAGTLWDAGGSDSLVSTPANWDRDRTPAFDGTAAYNFASAGSLATVNTNVHFLGMSIHRDADFLFADGGALLTLGAGGVRAACPSSVSRSYTIAARVALGASQGWGVTNNGAGSTTLIVSGPVTDGDASYGISKSGDGLLILSGDSDFDGSASVAAGGGLRVGHAKGLGSCSGGTDVASNGWIEVSGNITVPEPLTLRDACDAGALRATGGSNVWSGPITLAAPTRLRAAAGCSLTIAGGVSGASDLLLSPVAGGELAVAGSPLNLPARKIAANGEGTLTLASGGHTYGTFEVAGAGMRLRMGATNALSDSAVLSVGSSYSAQGVVDLNGFDQTVARLIRGTTSSSTNRIVTSSAPATLTVNETSASAVYFNGHLTGALGLTKGESGYLILSGNNNTYTGDTVVNGGQLEFGASARLGLSQRVVVNAGRLRLLSTNSISDSAMLSVADGDAKVRLESGVETVGALILGGRRKAAGTWGASGSGAVNTDDDHFEGAGVVNVLTTSVSTWDAGGANTSVKTPANWDYDTLPNFAGNDSVIFGLGGSSAAVDSDLSLSGVLLNRDSDFTLAGAGGTLSLGAGGITASGPALLPCVYTLAASVCLTADQSWVVTNAGSGKTSLVVSGPVSDGEATFGLAKSGSGLLTLSGNSSYDGATSVAAGGGLRVSHDHGLGSAAGGTDVASNGWVEIAGSAAVPEPLTLRDAGTNGALRSVSGTNVWSGPVTLAAPTRVRAYGGSQLTLAGGVSGSSDLFLSTEADGELAVSGGPITLPSRKICVYGEGSVLLSGSGHTYGTIEVAGPGMRLCMGARNALSPSSTLSVGAAYSAMGIVDLCGYDQTVARLVRGTTSTSTNRIVTSSSPATLTVNETSSSPIYFNGQLTGALGLAKGESGNLTLWGAYNTYTGATAVNGGTLEVGAASRLGFSPLVTVSSGTLRLLNPAALADNAVVRVARGGLIHLQSGTDTVSVLYLDGKRQRRGTYGSSASGAKYTSDVYFSAGGSGVIDVLHGPECILLVK